MCIFDLIEARGFQKGLREVREAQIKEMKQNVAIRSWEYGIPLHIISNITQLSINEVGEIIADYQQADKL